MKNNKYIQTVKKNIAEFQQQGQPLRIIAKFKSNPAIKINCGLCEWPDTSNKSTDCGLKYIYVLKNLSTGRKIFIGSECAQFISLYLAEQDSNFKIQNIEITSSSVEYYDEENDYKGYEKIRQSYEDKISYDNPYFNEREDLNKELRSDETYFYYFGDDDYEDIKDK